MSNEPLFTHFKQWIQITEAGAQAPIGAYFERVSGGEVQLGRAEAAPADSRGSVYRATRWRISEVSIEGYLNKDVYASLEAMMATILKNGGAKPDVTRVIRDGDGNTIKYLYENCTISTPPGIDDGDVSRDEFVMVRMGFQPENLIKYVNGAVVLAYKVNDTLHAGYEPKAEKAGNRPSDADKHRA